MSGEGRKKKPGMGGGCEHFNSPPEYLGRVRLVFSPGLVALPDAIDLDPCSNGGSVVGAKRCYTREQNGLDRRRSPWFGNVYINGPFNRLLPWALRGVEEWDAGNVQSLLYVTPLTAARWFQVLATRCTLWGIHRHRVPFLINGVPMTQPRFDCVSFYFGPLPDRFRLAFRSECLILPPAEDWIACESCGAVVLLGACQRCGAGPRLEIAPPLRARRGRRERRAA